MVSDGKKQQIKQHSVSIERRASDAGAAIDGLPILDDKQQAFVQLVLSGSTAVDAYKEAFAADLDGRSKPSIWSAATRLRNSRDVVRWIRAAQRALLDEVTITLERHQRQLVRLREMAIETGDLRTALGAEVNLGKSAGLYVERSEVTVHQPAQLLAQIAELAPGVAEQLARQFNVKQIDIVKEQADVV